MNQLVNRRYEVPMSNRRILLQVFYVMAYIMLIAPPRAIALTAEQREKGGELSSQPLIVVLAVELFMRVALVLLIAVMTESWLTETVYETYLLDRVFSLIVILGSLHTLSYYFLLGEFQQRIGAVLSMRIYRLARNLCYCAVPGLVAVIPVLVWQWKNDRLPFSDGLAFEVYTITTLLMLAAGLLEAMVMHRKPLGLDRNIRVERSPENRM